MMVRLTHAGLVSVVVVNYDGADDTLACSMMRSGYRSPSTEDMFVVSHRVSSAM